MSKSKKNKVITQTVLLIFGMHRSGTSAFAGLLKEGGIPMGKDLMKPAFDNPRGFYENEKIVALNERILNIVGQSWDAPEVLPKNWMQIKSVQSLQKEALQFIKSEFKDTPIFALKDPRFSLTLPFWQIIFETLDIHIQQYILVRHPYELANSLYKRNQLPKAMATALWLKYMLAATKVAQNNNSYFISFEAVVNDPVGVMQSLNERVQQALNHSEKTATSFIRKELRHHHINQPIHEPVLAESYAALLQLTRENKQKAIWGKLETIQQSDIVKQWIPVNVLKASLAIDYGNGFMQYTPVNQIINVDETQLIFDLPERKESEPIWFRLTLANQSVALTLKQIYWETEEGQQLIMDDFKSKALVNFKQKYVFNKDGYLAFYPLINGPKMQRLIVDLIYHKIGKWAASEIPVLHQAAIDFYSTSQQRTATFNGDVKSRNSTKSNPAKTNFWLSFLKTGMLSPVTFLKNINLDNFNTLRKALLNEPPTLILSNLKKKLLNKDSSTNQWQKEEGQYQQVESDVLLIQLRTVLEKPIAALPLENRSGTILYFSANLPDFDTSSGGKRATRYLALLAQDFEVVVYSLGAQSPKYIDHLTNLGIRVLPSFDYDTLKAEIPFLKAIICSTYPVFSAAKELSKHYPNTKLIVDTVDVHWLREERSIGVVDGYTKEKVAINKAREVAAYMEADAVWAVTAVDKRAILAEIPTAKIDIISNVHELEIRKYTDNGKKTLLFFGSYKHEPNISAVKTLAQTIFPKVQAIFEDAQLIIAGADAPKEIIELGTLSGVIYKGFIEEADLAHLYQNAFLVVAPLLAGAGIKGKICEAIAYRTPIVTTAIGNEGIDLIHETEGLITEPAEMAEVIIKALKRAYNFEEMTQKSANKLVGLVGEKAVKKNLIQAFYPEVSICIVTWNGLDLLKKCLTSIFENTNYPNYKILVYSNACTDGTVDYLKALAAENENVLPIFSKTNDVFVLPNNKMMKLYPNNEVVLLNNDTQVTPNWLVELHRAAYADKSIGIVGSKILYPDGRLQEFGAKLYEQGHGQNIGKGEDPNQAIYQTPTISGYVSGCAMYIKRSTIEKIGVFDTQFHPCYYEDSDYCYTAAEHGLKTVVTPHSQIYHEEGATAGQDTNSGFKRYQTVNKEKFIQKHQGKNNGIDWNTPLTTHHSSLTTHHSFIFTHIPKCGGTSFRQFINQAALDNGIKEQAIFIPGFNGLPDAKNLEQLNGAERQQLAKKTIKVLANHSKFEEHTQMGIHLERPFYYTILREPVARFISHYNFFYYQQGLDNCKGIRLEDLPQSKRSKLIQRLANLQIIYLTNSPVGMQVDALLLQQAKENLTKKYAAYGILENMNESIAQLHLKLPQWLKPKTAFPTLNKNKMWLNQLPNEIIAEIEKANSWDIQLYNWTEQSLNTTTESHNLITS